MITASPAAAQHLYVHIPFCPKICPYCSFYKEASDRNKTQAFLDAVLVEFERKLEGSRMRPRTIFFGGGTPSALSPKQLEYLLTGLLRHMDLPSDIEWTLEMNPATVSLEKAQLLRDLGVNRISMGVQSWEPRLLEILGRVHTGPQALRSYEILQQAGFQRINLDLIFGVPTQTTAEWLRSLEQTIALDPGHISTYCLTYEEDTVYFEKFIRGELQQNEETDADMFETTMELLENAGYEQYEISNHARPGKECLHNIAYWEGADYLGLGPSAFSTIGCERWQNIPDTAAYIQRIQADTDPAEFRESLTPEVRHSERLAFALRTNRGIPLNWLDEKKLEITEMAENGLVTFANTHVVLTRKGRLLADSIAGELL